MKIQKLKHFLFHLGNVRLWERLASMVVGIGICWPAHTQTPTHTHTLHTSTLPPSPWPQGYADLHILRHTHTEHTSTLPPSLWSQLQRLFTGPPSPTGHLAFQTTHQTHLYIFTYASLLSLIIYKLFFIFTWVLSSL